MEVYYADYDPDLQSNLAKVIEDYYKEKNNIESFGEGKKYLYFEVSASIYNTGDCASNPIIRYIL
jgi:hypothetical protein